MKDRKLSKRTEITKAEYLQLVGLFALGERLNRQQDELEAAAFEITQEIDNDGGPAKYGHTSDFLFSANSGGVDELLKRLRITVTD